MPGRHEHHEATLKRRQEHAAVRIQRCWRKSFRRHHTWNVTREILPPVLERIVLHSDSRQFRATCLRLHWDRHPLSLPVHRFRLQIWKEHLQIWLDLAADKAQTHSPHDLTHTAIVRDLMPGTVYYFRLRAYGRVPGAEAWVEATFATDRFLLPGDEDAHEPQPEGKHQDILRKDILETRRRRKAVEEAKTAERHKREAATAGSAASAASSSEDAALRAAAETAAAGETSPAHQSDAPPLHHHATDPFAAAVVREADARGKLSSPNSIEAYNNALLQQSSLTTSQHAEHRYASGRSKPPPMLQEGQLSDRTHRRSAKAVAVSLPWHVRQDADGYLYYWNSETNVSSWEPPIQIDDDDDDNETPRDNQDRGDGDGNADNSHDSDDGGVDYGDGWRQYTDPSTGHTYYHHRVTGQSTWWNPFAAVGQQQHGDHNRKRLLSKKQHLKKERPESAAPPAAWSRSNPRRAAEIRDEARAAKGHALEDPELQQSPASRKQVELLNARKLARQYEHAQPGDGDHSRNVNDDAASIAPASDDKSVVQGHEESKDSHEVPYPPSANATTWTSQALVDRKSSRKSKKKNRAKKKESGRGSTTRKQPSHRAAERRQKKKKKKQVRPRSGKRPPPPGQRHPLDAAFDGEVLMPSGWEERYDHSGNRYFYNRDSAKMQHHYPSEEPRTRKDSWAPDHELERAKLAASLGVDQRGGGGWVQDMFDDEVDWKGRRNYLAASKRASIARGKKWRRDGGSSAAAAAAAALYRRRQKTRKVQRQGRRTTLMAPAATKKSVPHCENEYGDGESHVLASSNPRTHAAEGDRIPLDGSSRAHQPTNPSKERINSRHLQYSYHDVESIMEVQREAMTAVLLAEQRRQRRRLRRLRRQKDSRGRRTTATDISNQSESSSDDDEGMTEEEARAFLQTVSEESLKRVGKAKVDLFRELLASRSDQVAHTGEDHHHHHHHHQQQQKQQQSRILWRQRTDQQQQQQQQHFRGNTSPVDKSREEPETKSRTEEAKYERAHSQRPSTAAAGAGATHTSRPSTADAARQKRPKTSMPRRKFIVELGAEYR